jgi:hypothetical protein
MLVAAQVGDEPRPASLSGFACVAVGFGLRPRGPAQQVRERVPFAGRERSSIIVASGSGGELLDVVGLPGVVEVGLGGAVDADDGEEPAAGLSE